jgi:cytidylate kinase
MIITIDGPAGSGKSSVAKALAEKLDIYYLNTGLLYRAIAFIWLKNDPNLEKVDNLNDEQINFIDKIEYKYIGKEPNIFYEDKNITKELFNNVISQAASILSAKKEIREKLIHLQQNVAKKYDIVAEGRDCGSVIFPKADYKFYLTASLDIRAKRIFSDNARKNVGVLLDEVKVSLEERDERDTNRQVAPLIVPGDAIVIDNSQMDQDQTIKRFLSKIDI